MRQTPISNLSALGPLLRFGELKDNADSCGSCSASRPAEARARQQRRRKPLKANFGFLVRLPDALGLWYWYQLHVPAGFLYAPPFVPPEDCVNPLGLEIWTIGDVQFATFLCDVPWERGRSGTAGSCHWQSRLASHARQAAIHNGSVRRVTTRYCHGSGRGGG